MGRQGISDNGSRRFLGPGQLLSRAGSQLRVRRRDGAEVMATLALAFPYRPIRGDELLLLEGAGAHYVIGVIKGMGRAQLRGKSVSIRSAGGRLRLSGDGALELLSRSLQVVARGTHEREATSVSARVRQARLLVERTLKRLTRDADQLVDREWAVQARRAGLRVKKSLRINSYDVLAG